MKKVLVTGAQGQLGKCIKDMALDFPELDLFYADREVLDVTSEKKIELLFENNKFDYCINAAAYTNVEKAESEHEKAFSVNAEGAKHIAAACNKHQTILLHISTDYVFDGTKKTPYIESDPTNPLSVYGASKLQGEQYIQETCSEHFILRTSWLYSQYGHNFYNSMRRFAKEGKELKITTEQLGTPTNANDLAKGLLQIIGSGSGDFGVYHFSNDGQGTWYDFAKKIFEVTGEIDQVNLAKTDHYRTFAVRPDFSVLSKDKYVSVFNQEIIDWKQSLTQLIKNTNQQ